MAVVTTHRKLREGRTFGKIGKVAFQFLLYLRKILTIANMLSLSLDFDMPPLVTIITLAAAG